MGCEVLLFPDASQAKTTVNITYLVGSRMENYGETGMAHLLEHMVFKGTPSRAQHHVRAGSARESTSTARRGSTAPITSRPFPPPTRTSTSRWRWKPTAWSTRLSRSKDLDSEMTVVRNEMERNENNAVRILIQRTMAAAYDWHSYGKDTIGARSDVEQVDIGRLQAFYRLYYQPDNAVLVVAGAFDPDKVLSLVSKYFGPIPKPTRVLPRLYTEEPVQDGERQVTLRRVGNTQWLSDLYHTVPGAHPDSVAIEAAVGVMTVAPEAACTRRWSKPRRRPASMILSTTVTIRALRCSW